MNLRFVTHVIDRSSGRRQGIFHAAYELCDSTDINAVDHQRLAALIDWYKDNLKAPDRFAATRRPHAQNQAISWFKDSATDHLARIWEMAGILESYGIQIETIRTRQPGFVVYEDDHQVTAIPFADTPT